MVRTTQDFLLSFFFMLELLLVVMPVSMQSLDLEQEVRAYEIERLPGKLVHLLICMFLKTEVVCCFTQQQSSFERAINSSMEGQ